MLFLKTNSFVENKILTFHLDIILFLSVCVNEIYGLAKRTISNGIHLNLY